jgi:hypothetical protein
MKSTKTCLDVDQIGGNEILSTTDEKIISQYIRAQKKTLKPLAKPSPISKTKNP